MAEELRIQITAKDGASQVFKAVADSAKKVSTELEAAGRDGEQGLDRVERGAKDAAREVDKISDSAKRASLSFRDFDFAITAIGAGLTYAGNAALEQQQTIIGLQSAYGDAAEEMINFADQMANVTIFNDDDILRGERYFATLRNNYDLTISEVQQLMQVTADLASAYGTSFEDASSRITAAIRGEGEAAEFLGLTMNQQAIDRENLTLTMTNQEAAQFRLNALYEQTGVYEGTSAALLESEVGTRAKLTNAIQDQSQALANFIGPLTSQLAGIGLASTGLASMIGVFGRLGPALRNSAAAARIFNLAINPMTITLGAVATGAFILWDAFQEGERRAATLAESLENLKAIQEDLTLSGEDERAYNVQGLQDYIQAVQDAAEARRKMFLEGTSDQRWAAVERLELESLGEAYRFFNEDMALTEEETERLTATQNKLAAAMADTRVDADALGAAVEQLWMRFMTDEAYTLDQFLADLENIDITNFRNEMDEASAAVNDFLSTLYLIEGAGETGKQGIDTLSEALDFLRTGLADGSVDLQEYMQVRADLNRAIAEGSITEERAAEILIEYARAADEGAGATKGLAEDTDRLAESLDRIVENATAATEAISAAGQSVGTFAAEMVDGVQAAEEAAASMGAAFGTETATRIDDITTRTQELSAAMLELSNNADYVSQINLTGLGTDATIAAEGLTDAAGALEQTFRVVVGNTNAIGSQVDSIQSWANELINVAGEYGKIDDLLNEGVITLNEYNAAQAAYNSITQDNASIQSYILEIQTMQAPLIAEQTAALEDQLETISRMGDAQEQLAALGWMDDGMQARVQQFAELGNQMEALGPAGEQAMQQIVDGIAATDPVLTAMLEDLGLIEETIDASGNKTYTVNMDAVGAMDSTERLIESIDALTLALGGVPPLDLEVTGWEDVWAAEESIYALQSAAAQDLVIDIATRLTSPEGDGTGGPEYTGEPVEVPAKVIDIELPDTVPPLLVPVEVDFSGMGSSAGGTVLDAARQALGLADDALTVTVSQSGAEETTEAVNGVQEAANALDGTTATITVTADVEQATGAIAAMGGYEGVNLATATVSVAGEASDALGTITAMSGYQGVEIATAIVGIDGDNSGAIATINATSGYEGVTIATAWVMVDGDNSDAVATINATAGYDGLTIATAYVDIVARNGSGFPTQRHGGIPGYASGGVIFEAGEAGPEMAYFAGGGMALLPSHGLYMAPEGTYISPNNALNGTNIGGVSVNVTVAGNVYGMDDLTEQVTRELAPALAEVATTHYREQGATW